MARIIEPDAATEKAWREWVAERPTSVRLVAERFEPWSLYLMKSTGQRVTVRSFYEDGTISVNVTGQFNAVMFDRYVFGIDPDDLEPCELPSEDAIVGTMLSGEEVDENIDVLRAAIRPDLWELDADGTAKRKSEI